MSLPTVSREELLPTTDPFLGEADLDLDRLAAHWAGRARLRPMTGEQMRGTDARARRLGITGDALMEEAGMAVAATARALMTTSERPRTGVVLILCGPGNNGGDGLVAARHLAAAGIRSAAVLVSADIRPGTSDALRNWDRLDGMEDIDRMLAATPRDVGMLARGLERASLVIDALLGTGVHGTLRQPIRAAVDLARLAREAAVPILAVDTPTALDLSSGEPSDPQVRADATVTFHRPKVGLMTRAGKALAGVVLVAPIGIPSAADST
jgi:hydroxyethylthiazole kinase-like uncharacterized protein yjeF